MLVRIDDYPTGVKPIIENRFEKFDSVLRLFEEAEVPYHLGVVPKLIDKEDGDYLKSLKHARLCLHGYDHNFERWKTHPEDRDEFRGMTSKEIAKKLWSVIGELFIDYEISLLQCYIPTFNTINQPLLDALNILSVDYVTTGVKYDTSLDFGKIARVTPKDKFYGTSDQIYENMNVFGSGDHVALHLTWEIEQKEKYGENWRLPWIVKFLENYK